ncbi:unnamed protein product [Effrenium voratum]|nr:unnamed protein product [Effrenium voratum]
MARWRFLVVTAFDVNYEVGFLCSTVNEAYCRQHGYGFLRLCVEAGQLRELSQGRHLAWAKVALLCHLLGEATHEASCLASVPPATDVDYVVWVDADAMVLDQRQPLEAFVELAQAADFIIGEDMADTDLLNTGLMFFRSSDYCRRLARRWWIDSDPHWHHELCWDQTGLCRLLEAEGLGISKPWFSWCGGPRFKRFGSKIFVFDCGGFNFKYVNNCAFVFHAVGERELLFSFSRQLLLKRDRLAAAVREGFVVGGQNFDQASTNLPPSAVSEAGRALEFWRAFGVGRTGKAGHGPPLGWAPCDETSPLAEQAEMEVGPQESREGLALRFGEAVVALRRPSAASAASAASGEESCRARLWQVLDYADGRLPPFGPLSFTSTRPWRLHGWRAEGLASLEAGGLFGDPVLDVEPPNCQTPLQEAKAQCHVAVLWGAKEFLLFAPSERLKDLTQSVWDDPSEVARHGLTVRRRVLRQGHALHVPRGWWITSRGISGAATLRRSPFGSSCSASKGCARSGFQCAASCAKRGGSGAERWSSRIRIKAVD